MKTCAICGKELIRSWIKLEKGEFVCSQHVDFKALAQKELETMQSRPKPKKGGK